MSRTGPTAPEGTPGAGPIRRLLVANRGELVVRIARTCREHGVRCLALVTPDQRAAWWASQADEQVPLDASYLDVDAVIAAALHGGADAVHPGYGFLAERPDFAEAVLEAGLTWVGPPAAAIRAVGDKSAARQLARRVGVPVLPGYDGEDQSDERLRREAKRIGYPVLAKPSAGGGGKGMHVVPAADELPAILAQARREALAALGDERLVLERFVEAARHVEVQVCFDAHGSGVHLGERDCSLQRRHQKVIEEAPAPSVGPELRERLAAAALRIAGAAGYVGAGTVEFLVADVPDHGRDAATTDRAAGLEREPRPDHAGARHDGEFFFLEMNTRLQVEHPVTEMVTGRDLVAAQLRIATGDPLGFTQADVRIEGHAFEARLYAEDPRHGFLPASGDVVAAHWPAADGFRVDAGVAAGDVVGLRYDPLLAKLVVHGRDRDTALERLEAALEATRVHGVTTNLAFLRWLARLPDVVAADARVDTIERRWQGIAADEVSRLPERAWQLAARALAPDGRAGFRLNAPRRLWLRQGHLDRAVEMEEEHSAGTDEADGSGGATTRSSGETPVPEVERAIAVHDVAVAAGSETTAWVDVDGGSVPFRLAPAPGSDGAARRGGSAGAGGVSLVAPMPGTVLSVGVVAGEVVEARQALLTIEAMKMEHAVPAPGAGRVVRVAVVPGQVVQRGELLVEIA